MFKYNLCILICVLFRVHSLSSSLISNLDFRLLFVSRFSCSPIKGILVDLKNLNRENQRIFDNELNDYTLKYHSVIYSKDSKKSDEESKLTKRSGKRSKKKSESINDVKYNGESEAGALDFDPTSRDLKEEMEPEEEGDDMMLSNRMFHSILSLTSSVYTPNFFDIIPILYTIKDNVLNITSSIGSETKFEDKGGDKMKKINGIFINNDKGEVERLLLSIPSTELNRLSQSSKYKTEVESSDNPILIISLGRGFFSKVYELIIYPYLSQIFQSGFDTKLEGKLGFMDYIKGIRKVDDEKGYEELDEINFKKLSMEEFEEAFKDHNVTSKKKFDTSVFSKEVLESLTNMTKCIKDLVYFNSCLLLLQQILGRKPNDAEILYSFVPDDNYQKQEQVDKNDQGEEEVQNNESGQKQEGEKEVVGEIGLVNGEEKVHVDDVNQEEVKQQYDQNQNQKQLDQKRLSNNLVKIISYSENEIYKRIATFFVPFIDVAIINFKKKLKKDKRYYKMMLRCSDDALTGITTRMLVVHPKIINVLKKNFIVHLFKICYHHVKLSAITRSLPMHLPLATLRLARKALKLLGYLENIQKDIIYKYQNDLKGSKNIDFRKVVEELEERNRDRIPIDNKIYKEYLEKILQIEDYYEKRKGDNKANEYMKLNQQDHILKQTAAKVLNVSSDRMIEAIVSYRAKEVSPSQKIPTRLRSRRGIITSDAPKSPYYIDSLNNNEYDGNPEEEYQHKQMYRRTMRKLAMEAIEDRLTRLLFMSHSELLLDRRPDYEELITHLEIPKKTADFMVFTATLMCKEYEVWRIKLSLPPYVSRKIYSKSGVDLSDHPYYTRNKSDPYYADRIYVSEFEDLPLFRDTYYEKGDDVVLPTKRRKDKINTFRRMKAIKPNLSSAKDLLMNYKKNYKEYEKILERSLIYDLCRSEYSPISAPFP